MAKLKILVVDDSAFMRKLIGDMLRAVPSFEVVGTASNGQEALLKAGLLKPDVITLDVQMPVMDGVSALRRLMATQPTPVVMLSSVTTQGSELAVKCLELGAVDFVAKPSGAISMDLPKVASELTMKIKAAATAKLRSPKPFAMHTVPSLAQKHPVSYSSHWPLVVIGASTGGPRALTAIFQALPEDLYASVIVIQHMPEGFTEAFSDRLNKIGPLSVAEGSEGAQLKVGCVYVAPGGQHMKLTERGVLHLSKEAPVHGVRPAVDVMMLSIAKYWRSNVIAVVLTGMGVDGAAGVMALSQRGAHVIAEDESSCVVFGMPKAAIGTGCVKRVVPLEMIPTAIAEGVKAQCKVLTAS